MPDTHPQGGLLNQNLKRFGYHSGEPAAPRLCRALKLSNDPSLFKKILMTIETLAENHLDLKATLSDQQDILLLIKDEIISKYPLLFAGKVNEANLFFALRVAIQKHQRERRYLLKRARRSAKRRESKNLDLTLDGASGSEFADSENLDQDDSHEGGGSELYMSDTENQDQHEPHRFRTQAHPIPNTRLRSRTHITARAAHTSNASAQTIKVNTSTAKSNQKRPFSRNPSLPEGQHQIHQFLNTCNPSMHRFLPHFINFGCHNHEFLREIASWAPEKRLAILKKILMYEPEGMDSENAVPATEMEIAIIENNLEVYFADEH